MSKKLSRFFNFLFFFAFFLVIIFGAALALVYTQRDTILLYVIRNEAPKHFSELQLDSVVTRPIGRLSVELHGLTFKADKSSPRLKSPKLLISSPLTAFEIYNMYLSRGLVPLKLQLTESTIDLSDESTEETASQQNTESPDAVAVSIIEKLPVGLALDLELRENTINTHNLTIQNISGILKAGISFQDESPLSTSGQVAFSVKTRTSTSLPARVEWSAAGKTSDIALSNIKVAALGFNLIGSGRYSMTSKQFEFAAGGATADLSVIPLDAKESETLGLSGRLEGALSADLSVKGKLGGTIVAEGLIDLRKGVLPIHIERDSPNPMKVIGRTSLNINVPFKVEYDLQTQAMTKMVVNSAIVHADLTSTELRLQGRLQKPKDTPLSLNAQWSVDGKTVYVTKCAFTLANLNADINGTTSIDPKGNSELNFSLQLPSLAGWPTLVPVFDSPELNGLRDNVDFASANGSISLKGSISGPLQTGVRDPQLLDVSIEQLDVSALRLPINLRLKDTPNSLKGQILGALSLKAKKIGEKFSIQNSTGELNLTSLGLDFPGLITKSAKTPLTVAWRAGGNSEFVRLDHLELQTDQARVGLNGRFQYKKKLWTADGALQAVANLEPLYEFLPVLAAVKKTVGGAKLQSDIKFVGEITPSTPMQSTLAVSGNIRADIPSLIFGDTKDSTKVAESGGKSAPVSAKLPEFLSTPLFRKASLRIDSTIASVQLSDIKAERVTAGVMIANNTVTSQAHIGSVFGGELNIKDLKVTNIDPAYPLLLVATGTATGARLSLKNIAEWMKPEYANDVSGTLDASARFSIRPYATGTIVANTEADGSFLTKGTRFSARPLAQLARETLEEKIKGLPGFELWGKPYLQEKQPAASQNLLADIRSQFSLKSGVLSLPQLVVLTSEQDELVLKGNVDSALNSNLAGEARLKSVNIGGSFREANSDLKGRLVVPLSFKGPLTSPSTDIAADALATMAKRTADLESKKLKKTVTNSVKKEIEKKKTEVIDGIKDQLKRGLGL